MELSRDTLNDYLREFAEIEDKYQEFLVKRTKSLTSILNVTSAGDTMIAGDFVLTHEGGNGYLVNSGDWMRVRRLRARVIL